MKSICFAVSCLIITAATADTITVCSSGCDYTSINDAIDAASNGDVIQLSDEVYYEGEEINTDGKAITLRGAVLEGFPQSVLDGGETHRVLHCAGGEGADTVFENLLIKNGHADNGAGMRIAGARPTLNNCWFDMNGAEIHGGGLMAIASWSTLVNCRFTGNFVGECGGGLYGSNSSLRLTDCVFGLNLADYGGGMCNVASSPTLTNCTFESNIAQYGGGIGNNSSSSPIIITCTFEDNVASLNGGALYSQSNSNPILTNSTVCGNTADQIAGDWTDNGGNAVAAECSQCFAADFNSDGHVDAADLGMLLAAWGLGGATDINGDGTTDAADLGMLLSFWGPCP